MNTTINYYNLNAKNFIENTQNADMHLAQEKFLQLLPGSASILDFGCGSGRDTKYFLEKGYQVAATDGSAELCRLAGSFTGIKVKEMLFQEYGFYNDGNVRMAVTEDEVIESWKRFFNRGTNWKDFPQVTSYEEYRRITDKQHLSKAKSMPIKFLKASGKGFFIDKDGYALGIRDELADVIKVDAFKKQMKDIIEYRTMEYYRRRYVEK